MGCEFYVCNDRMDKSYKDNGYQIPFLAKNKNGYQNLIQLCSAGFVEGFYYVPRIDRNIIPQFKEDVITRWAIWANSSNDLNEGESKAEEAGGGKNSLKKILLNYSSRIRRGRAS